MFYVCDWWPTSRNFCFIPTPDCSIIDKQIKTLSSRQNLVSDDYKPDKEDSDESCSSGVDENELEDETQSEEDIEDISEKVLI